MNETEKIAGRYRLLFSLPSLKSIMIIIFILSLLFGEIIVYSTMIMLNKPFNFIEGIIWSIILYLVPAIISIPITDHIIQGKIFNTRRLAGLSLLSMILATSFQVICTVSLIILGDAIRLSSSVMISGFSVMNALRYLALEAIESKKKKSILAAAPQPVFSLVGYIFFLYYFHIFMVWRDVLMMIYGLGSFTLASWFLLETENKRLWGDSKTTKLQAFQAFLKNWLLNDPEPLEKILLEKTKKEKVRSYLINFYINDKARFSIVVPQIHFGPFKNIGSSNLPPTIISKLKQKGICSVVLHGAETHEKDLATQEDKQKYLNALINKIKTESKNRSKKATKIIRVSKGTAKVYCQRFEKDILIIVTRAPQTTDDLPKWVSEEILKEAKKNNLRYVILVDAHNSLGQDKPNNEDYKEIILAVKIALKKVMQLKQDEIYVSINHWIISGLTEKEGIGKGGISSISIGVSGEKETFIVFDGNNMVPQFRDEVIRILNEEGIKKCETLTTDTHSVSALITNKRGYYLIGDKINREILLRHIRNIPQKIDSNLKKVEYEIQEIITDDVNVLGEEVIKRMSQRIDESLKEIKIIFITLYPLITLTLVLLGFL